MSAKPTNTAQVLALLTGLSCLPLGGLTLLAFMVMLGADSPNSLALSLMAGYLVSLGGLLVGSTALFNGRGWARRVMLVAAVIGLLVVAYVSIEARGWFVLFGLPHAAAGFFLTMPAFDVSPNYDEVRAPRLRRRYLLVGALFAGLAMTLTLAEDEIREVGWELRGERWKSQCESTGAPEPCGRWALRQVFWSDDDAEVRAGLRLLDELCTQQKVHRSCEYAAKLRSDRGLMWMYGRDDSFFERRRRRAAKACREGVPGGCVLEAWLREELRDVEAARAACEKGDESACVIVTYYDEEARLAACDGDFSSRCQRSTECTSGIYQSCGDAEDPLEEALGALWDLERDNPALYGARVSVPEGADSCDDGAALACFVDGLNGTADVNPFSDPLPQRSMEVTFGRACELGHGVSCYVFAVRLLDQRSPTAEQRALAGELLESGCARGDERSCWLDAMLDDPMRDVDRHLTRAQAACEHAVSYIPTCTTRDHALAYTLGVEPHLVADNDAYRRMRWGCWKAGDERSCTAGAALMLRSGRAWMPAVPPLLVQGSRLAETACRGGNARGCRLLFEFASFQQRYGRTTPDKLRSKICPQVPRACEDAK